MKTIEANDKKLNPRILQMLFWSITGIIIFFLPHFRLEGRWLNGPALILANGGALYLYFLFPLICLLIPVLHFIRPDFNNADNKKSVYLPALSLFSSFLPFVTAVVLVFSRAYDADFFRDVSILFYLLILLSLYNIFDKSFALVLYILRKNPVYIEYHDFSRNFRSERPDFFISIRSKLLTAFTILILLIIITLITRVLSEYRSTILEAIAQTGRTLSAESAKFFKTNLGSKPEIESYLYQAVKVNENARFRFARIVFFQKEKGGSRFIAAYATSREFIGRVLNADMTEVFLNNGTFFKKDGIYYYAAPVELSGKIIGFSVAGFTEKMIFRSYYNTKLRVFIITALLLYISIVMIYFFGTNIVMPVLFLQMGVKKISLVLEKLLGGDRSVSASLLTYHDLVESRDEIFMLDREVKNMVGVIRGLIPYVSFGTLRQAKDEERSISSRRDLCFLFTDMRGFTTFCEGLSPQEVVNVLNTYLNLQSEIIIRNSGDIDKFMGDAVMAVFEGPDKEKHACRACLEIRAAMLKEKTERLSKNQHVIDIGIGINSGEATFGSIGAQNRMDFTSIGDNVNLASRLEGATKTYHTGNLISESTWLQIKDFFLCREIDLMTVKGKSLPVRIYEVLCGEQNSGDYAKLRDGFEKGLACYRKQKWEQAEKAFTLLSEKLGDETSGVFLERISIFKKSPPPEKWDGVFVMTVK